MNKTPYQVKQAIYRGKLINAYVSTDGKMFDMDMKEKSYFRRKSRPKDIGYLCIRCEGVVYLVHRAVAETFIPNPDNLPTVNHKLGDKTKNGVDDLEWMSYSDNNKHAIDMGLRKPLSCDKHQNATLTNEQVHSICKMLEDGVLYDDIIEILELQGDPKDVRRRLIMIKNGYAWKQISSQYNISERRNSGFDKYTDEQIHGICKLMQDGEMNWRKIVDAVGLEATPNTRKLVSVIRNGSKHARSKVVSQYNIPPYANKRIYTEDQIRYICYLIQSDPTLPTENIITLADLPVNDSTKLTVNQIRWRKTHRDISKDYKW